MKILHPPYMGKPIPPVSPELVAQVVNHVHQLLSLEDVEKGRVKGHFVASVPLSHLSGFSYPAIAHAMIALMHQGWEITFCPIKKSKHANFHFTLHKQSQLYADMLAFQTSLGKH